MSLGGNYNGLVIVDDYSKYTWTLFLRTKNDAFDSFRKLSKVIKNEKGLNIVSIRSDHGGEFQNECFEKFCEENWTHYNFSAARTPQQNGVMEGKSKSLEEVARTLLNETNLSNIFGLMLWVLFVTLNRLLIRPILKKNPYELYKGRKPNISHLRFFGCEPKLFATCFDNQKVQSCEKSVCFPARNMWVLVLIITLVDASHLVSFFVSFSLYYLHVGRILKGVHNINFKVKKYPY